MRLSAAPLSAYVSFSFSWSKYLPSGVAVSFLYVFLWPQVLFWDRSFFVLRSRTAISGVGFELSEFICPVGRDPTNSLSMTCLPAYSRRLVAWKNVSGEVHVVGLLLFSIQYAALSSSQH